MIIHSIVAENLLKYQRLELKNIPPQGLIGISGYNESGKSSIGESICFALFGRSFAVGDEDLQKLIRWRAINCTTEMEFSARDGARYRVSRYLDRDGNHSARLSKLGDEEHPIARGGEAVTDAVHELLGFAFDEFIESFYLAQREITTPHPHSHAVKTMAGVAPMEICRDGFHEDFEREQGGLGFAREKAREAAVRLQRLDYKGTELTNPQAEHKYLLDLDGAAKQRLSGLRDCVSEYQEKEPQIRGLESSRGTLGILRFLALLLAVLGIGLWGLLTQMGDSEPGRLVGGLLQGSIPGWQAEQANWFLYAGVVFVVLLLVFWSRIRGLDRRLQGLRDLKYDLEAELQELDALEPALLERMDIDSSAKGRKAKKSLPRQRLNQEMRAQLIRRVSNGSAGSAEINSGVAEEIAWLDQARAALQRHITVVDKAIDSARGRRDTHNKLSGIQEAFEQQEQEHMHQIRVCELADELLLGSSRYLSRRFNYNLRGLVGKTLPLFTEGRYEHLQIGEDLMVKAFSNEKRDFVGLDEISSGTQRQIMLALRLSLSQELINQVVKYSQFTFLDEPFAFFDEERTRSSLEVLPQLSDDINQIWIVAQEFPSEVAFDKEIHCERGLDWYTDSQGGSSVA